MNATPDHKPSPILRGALLALLTAGPILLLVLVPILPIGSAAQAGMVKFMPGGHFSALVKLEATATLTATATVTTTGTLTTTATVATTGTLTTTATVTTAGTLTTTATVATTGTLTTTATVATTATLTTTATRSPTASLTPTATLTPTSSVTATPVASIGPSASPMATFGATPSVTPTSTGRPPLPIFLPWLAASMSLAEPRPRIWGMQFVMEYDAGRHADNVLIELPRAHAAGIRSVRSDLRWMDVEANNTTPDRFDWRQTDRHLGDYSAAGFDALLSIIAYPRWAMEWSCGGSIRPGMEAEWREFVRAAAERYSRPPYRVAAWEIGNEVDGTLTIDDRDRARPPAWGQGEPTTPHGGCWAGRAIEYARFVRAAAEEIRAVDPSARVTHGGLAYVDPLLRPAEVQAGSPADFDIRFLEDFLLAGGCDSVDFFGYHWFLDYPWQPRGDERHRQFAGTLRRYGCPKPIWITDTYRVTTPDASDPREARQVHFLSQEILAVLSQPELERIYWYGWVDFPRGPGDGESSAERGLVRRDRRPKIGLQVLPYTISHSNGIPEDLSTDRVAAYRFRWPREGRTHLIAWSKTGQGEAFSLPAPAAARQGVTARIFDRSSLEAGRCCLRIPIPVVDGQIRLELGVDSAFVEIGPPAASP